MAGTTFPVTSLRACLLLNVPMDDINSILEAVVEAQRKEEYISVRLHESPFGCYLMSVLTKNKGEYELIKEATLKQVQYGTPGYLGVITKAYIKATDFSLEV